MTKKERAAAALELLVDELGDLETEIQPWRAKFARVEALRAAVRSAFAGADPAATFTPTGERWSCQVGTPGAQSVVDRAALLKLIGPKKFAEIAAISLKALEAACGAHIAGQVVSLAPTGPRSLAVVPRAPAAKLGPRLAVVPRPASAENESQC